MTVMTAPLTTSHPSSGARLAAVDGRELPLRSAALEGDARGGLARVRLAQTFHNPYPEPLTVTYTLPLPHEGAVSGFTFVVGEETIVGEVDRRSRARERFEEAIVEGKSAALLEEDRSTLFRQEVGNIPPNTDVEVRIDVDQRLVWQDSGWEWRFPTVAAPRYLGEPGRVADAGRVVQQVADRPSSPRLTLSFSIRDAVAGGDVASPSHQVRAVSSAEATEVGFRSESGAELDRDVVVRWPVATPEVGVGLDLARPRDAHPRREEVHGLLSLVPPTSRESTGTMKRDLIVLLDTSGSMSGRPLDQAKEVVRALIAGLGAEDRLEMIEFSTRARSWKRKPQPVTASNARAALWWLSGLSAGGGTEMRSGILAAMDSLREEAQRQVLLVSDGLIGFENEVIASILEKLPGGCRLHTVGIGSAVNRSLTAPAARAGRGIEVVLGLDDEAAPAAKRLAAAMEQPVVVDLELEGNALLGHAPERLPDLLAGRPALVALCLRPEGGRLTLRGRTESGSWNRSLEVPAAGAGHGTPAISALYAREGVEDLEMCIAGHGHGDAKAFETQIERLGLDFQIATRLTTWIAVSESVTVDPRDAARREVVPQQLPYGMSAEGLGLRPSRPAIPMAARMPRARGHARAQRVAAPIPEVEGIVATSMNLADLEQALFEKDARLDRRPEDIETAGGRSAGVLSARVALNDKRRLVLEIELDFELDWKPGEEVEVVLEDGRRVRARVQDRRTTRAGRLRAGQSLRLTLDPVDGEVARVFLADGTEIRVERG